MSHMNVPNRCLGATVASECGAFVKAEPFFPPCRDPGVPQSMERQVLEAHPIEFPLEVD